MAATRPSPPSWRSTSAYLGARTRLGVKFGLETVRALLDALGRPETAQPVLLVAGTNGKGSVAAYVEAALRASGLRTGRYTSPHLVRVQERVVVGGREIGDRDLARAVGNVREVAEALGRAGTIPAAPTYFEVLTAAAFDHFRSRRLDVAVIEVGLGGRLDATNATDPLASAVVTVDFDHRQFLGDTLAEIAREKAGVMRPGRAVVVGEVGDEARGALEAEAARLGARLTWAAEGSSVEAEAGGTVTVRTPAGVHCGLRPLPGAFQRHNLLVAVRLLEEAAAAGLPVRFDRLAEAVAGTVWPGRLQAVPGRPPLLLDGAHNPAGARALLAHLRDLGEHVLVFGAMGDKDIAAMAGTLFPAARAVVLTRPPLDRAAEPGQVAREAAVPGVPLHVEPSVGRALRLARRLAGPRRTVVVAGSLYLVGDVLRRLTRSRRGSGARRPALTAAGRPAPGAGGRRGGRRGRGRAGSGAR